MSFLFFFLIKAQLGSMTPEQIQAWRWEKELDERNRPLSDDELDILFPQEGYKILAPPSGYQPIRTPARKLTATPTPMGMSGFHFQVEENKVSKFIIIINRLLIKLQDLI